MYRSDNLKQPDSLPEILALRPNGADVLPQKPEKLRDKIKGALMGRFAGCVLGIPVEMYDIQRMNRIALENGMEFPPTSFWKGTDSPDSVHYGVNRRTDYMFSNIDKVPVDDDITYTLLNLLLLEKYGKEYTVNDVAELWLELLPYACTAEDEALQQLRCGTRPECAALFNPYIEWIGAAIRADSFGYAEAGDPAAAASLSYNDAFLTHRMNGIYGEMFCAATVAAAFTAKTPLDAVRAGMKQIPQESKLYKDLVWALSFDGNVGNYLKARYLVDQRFPKMSSVHTNNNMCLIVFALMLGENDFTKCIGNGVAMGLDNDCTGATIGSIVGACFGYDALPQYWFENFNDTVCTYINGYETFSIENVVDRFVLLNK